jgi:predicted RNase H-like HicB family nuclease
MLNIFNIFKAKIVSEVLIAYKGRFPEKLEVSIKPSQDGGYVAYISNLPGCMTQAETGQKIFEMVNDAVYTYLQIPEEYQLYMPVFFPPESVRKEFDINIPAKYLKESLVFQKI